MNYQDAIAALNSHERAYPLHKTHQTLGGWFCAGTKGRGDCDAGEDFTRDEQGNVVESAAEEPEQVNTDPWADRHPSVAHFKPLFEFGHLPAHLAGVSAAFSELADELLTLVQDGPELSAGLRSLLQAKDAVVRQAVLDRQ